MADVDPYKYPDASKADQLRFLKQQYAEAATAKETHDGRRRVVRQDLTALQKQIESLEEELNGTSGNRFGIAHTRHARR